MPRAALATLLLLGLGACHGIGEGNTIAKVEVVPTNSSTQAVKFETGGTYRLYQCLRDELLLVGTFDSGAVANFNSRATWSSSDENVVRVSNRDVPVTYISNGAFAELAAQPYAGGTVIPTGNVGDEATITASFAGLSASINVVIRKPELRLAPVPFPVTEDPFAFTPPASLGEGTHQRLALIGNFDGRVATGIGGGAINTLLNPILWKFPGGTYQPVDEDAATIYDGLWTIPAGSPQATLNGAGTVRGLVAGGGAYDVEAQLSLCSDSVDPDLKPVTSVRVLPFATTTPLTLEREAGFHDAGSFAPPAQFSTEDVVPGSNQILLITGHLDSDGDGVGDLTQNLGEQSRFNFEPKDSTCDAKGLICEANSLFSILVNDDIVSATTGGSGRLNDGFDLVCVTNPTDAECVEETDPSPDLIGIEACFPLCQPRRASLAAENPLAGPVISLSASTFGLSGTPRFVFDCGDGSALQDTGSTPTADCDYTGDTGPFTATVRVLDDNVAVSANAGAVQIHLGAVIATNTAPTASLAASPATVTAPAQVFFSASGSNDADTDDSVTVYEFQPEPGVIVRQSSAALTWVYLAPPATAPSLIVYDEFGTPSAAKTVELTVTGTAPAPFRSAMLPLRATPATPCAIEILPPSATETAFTYPGLIFEAVASFIATKDDATQDCAVDSLIGTQKVSRYVDWIARPAADSEDTSEYVSIRDSRSDFQTDGQTVYLSSPAVDTTVVITAGPTAALFLKDLEDPAPASLVVQPCPAETCPP